MKLDFALVKQHPIAATGAVLIGGFVVYLVLHTQSVNGAAVQAQSSGFDSVAAGYDLQARAIQADVAKSQMAVNGQLQLAQIGGQYNLALAKENNAATISGVNTAAGVQLAQIASAGDIATKQISAQLEANRQATGVQQATISAGLAQFLAGTQAQVQLGMAQIGAMQNIAAITADVQKTQIIQTAGVQRAQIKAASGASNNNAWMQVAGMVAMALI